MAFELDFNSASAEQRVESLISKLRALSQEATKASQALTPPPSAIDQMKESVTSTDSAAKSMKGLGEASSNASKQVQQAASKNAKSSSQVVAAIEKELQKHREIIDIYQNKGRVAEREMAKERDRAKIRSTNLVNEEARTQKLRQAQLVRYNTHMQKSKEVWAANDLRRKRTLAQTMSRLAQQTMREEQEALSRRSQAWTSYYARQEAQIARYRAALNQSRATVAQHAASSSNALRSTTSNINVANQAAAGFRATLAGLGMGFGIYTGSTIALAASVYALTRGMKHALDIGSEFEKSMYRVFAVTSTMGQAYEKNGIIYVNTTDDMVAAQNRLRQAALEASVVTVFTGNQAAEGLVALGMAGLNAEASIGALTPSLQLAQIGMIDVYESADIMTNVMLGFGMSIDTVEESLKNASHVTDVLASAITNSNSTIREMARSLSYVAPIASAAGGSIEETVAVLETFHNVGIKGQRAGTALRRAYVNLMEPTDKVAERLRDLGVSTRNSNGEMVEIIDIMTDLKNAGADAADMVTIFGVRAAPAMIALMANLEETRKEMNRLRNEADGAGEAMARFMASATREQWGIIRSKISKNFIEAFQEAEPAIRRLNIAIKELVDADGLDFFFGTLSAGITMAANEAARLVGFMEYLSKFASQNPVGFFEWRNPPGLRDSPESPLAERNPKTKAFLKSTLAADPKLYVLLNAVGWYYKGLEKFKGKVDDLDLTEKAAVSIAEFPSLLDSLGADLEAMDPFRSFRSSMEVTTEAIDDLLFRSEEQAAEYLRIQESAAESRAKTFRELEAQYGSDSSFSATATSARREASLNNEVTKYQEKLGLISKETSLASQLTEIEKAKLTISERYQQEMEKHEKALERIRGSNQGMAADKEAYETVLKRVQALTDQYRGQQEQLNAEFQKTTLALQESMMMENGFGKLSDDVTSFQNSLVVATERLKGNSEASEENTLEKLRNAVATREAWQQTSEFTKLTDDQRTAFMMETEAMRDRLPVIESMLDGLKKLRAEKEAEAKFDKMSKEFGRGKNLSSEAKATLEYHNAFEAYAEYMANKDELMREYGLSEMEFHQMIESSKMEASQKMWDAQHENLAKWRDDWSKTIADQMEKYLFMEQGWKETINNISRQMLGTVVNTIIRIGAERTAQHLMEMAFTKREMAMTSASAANKVAAESTKAVAVTTTAAAEQTAAMSGMAYFGQMLGIAPALAAAWAPVAMYVNIASFGAAGVAATGSMILAGAATAAAGFAAGAGGVAGARQFGGRTVAGNSYYVGENGREVFTPDTSGRIISNQDLYNSPRGSGSVAVSITNHYHIDATGNEDFEDRLENALEQAGDMGHRKVLEDLNTNGQVAKMVQRIR